MRLVGAKTSLTCVDCQTKPSQGRRYRAENGNLCKFGTIYRHGTVCTKAIFISKGSYGYGESRNVFLWSVQKPLLPVMAVKLLRLKGGGIGPRTETCVNSGGSIALVPCVHQGNIHIKRQPGVCRVQKCIPLVGAKTPLTCVGSQTTLSEGRRYRTENGNLRKLGRIYRLGTVFAPR